MARKIVRVTFNPCGSSGTVKTTRVIEPELDEDEFPFDSEYDAKNALINKAANKIYGPRCYWWADSGLGINYGQVMESLRSTKNNSNPGSSSKTYRMRVEIED